MSFLLSMAGHLAGLSDKQLDDIERAMPATRKLIDLINEARPLILKAEPIINEALEEWKAVAPAADDIVTLLQRQGQKP
jgi:hypothetical protein